MAAHHTAVARSWRLENSSRIGRALAVAKRKAKRSSRRGKAGAKRRAPKRRPAPKRPPRKPARARPAPDREAYQAALVRYQVMCGLAHAANAVPHLAQRIEALAVAARALAELRAQERPKKKEVAAAIEAAAKRERAAFKQTGDVVADRILEMHAPEIVQRRLGSEPFDLATAGAPRLSAWAGGLEDLSRFVRALPPSAQPVDPGAPLEALAAWVRAEHARPSTLAHLMVEAEIEPPEGSRGAPVTAWERALRSGPRS
jgi:hypothetical protein